MLNLEKRLEVGGEVLPLVKDEVTLELNGVGRGVFQVRGGAGPEIGVAARFFAGYRGSGKVYPMLTGLVAESARLAPDLWRVVVREPAMLLDARADFFLRHTTPRGVLARIEELTGLAFLIPAEAGYADRRIPYFLAEGTCRQAIEALGPAWEIERALWFTLPDGRIFWGDWADGPFKQSTVPLDSRLVVERDPEARAIALPYLPRLRPGVVVEMEGVPTFMVRRAAFAGDRVRLEWGEV